MGMEFHSGKWGGVRRVLYTEAKDSWWERGGTCAELPVQPFCRASLKATWHWHLEIPRLLRDVAYRLDPHVSALHGCQLCHVIGLWRRCCGTAWRLSEHLPFHLGNVNESQLLFPSIVEELSLGTFLSVRIMYLERAEASWEIGPRVKHSRLLYTWRCLLSLPRRQTCYLCKNMLLLHLQCPLGTMKAPEWKITPMIIIIIHIYL